MKMIQSKKNNKSKLVGKLKEELDAKLIQVRSEIKNLRAEFEDKKSKKRIQKIRENFKPL